MVSIDQQLTLDQQDAADREQRYVDSMLSERGVPERLHYAAGVLLDAEDFEDEQTYHRSRLGRALAALLGFGTVAGLKAECKVGDNPGLEVKVAPGLALDRLGRLIEVRRTQCLKVADWLAARAGSGASSVELERRNEVTSAVVGDTGAKHLLLDVWLRYVPCAHGRTPAFAAGPFNATDYTVPARLADGFEITLDVAADPTGATGLPKNALPLLDKQLSDMEAMSDGDRANARAQWMIDSVLDAWVEAPEDSPQRLALLAEHRTETSWNSIFLARIDVPVKPTSDADPFPQIDATRLTNPTQDLANNHLRPVVFIPTAWRGQAA
jgi:hypothetical protein